MNPDTQASISHAGEGPDSVRAGRALAQATVDRLLAVNRDFYAAVSRDFDLTRSSIAPGMREALNRLYPDDATSPNRRRVLDAGCGNGRFAWALDARAISADYLGIDADAGLLALARAQSDTLKTVRSSFRQHDLMDTPWTELGRFNLVACLAVLHHMPGRALRVSLMRSLASVLAPGGRLLISTWQFLDDERLRSRVQPWEAIGLSASDVEPGDALLPWDQGVHALRYAHHIDVREVTDLAAAASLTIADVFPADGKSGRLNLYTILAHA